jgi:hypothetical protein
MNPDRKGQLGLDLPSYKGATKSTWTFSSDEDISA